MLPIAGVLVAHVMNDLSEGRLIVREIVWCLSCHWGVCPRETGPAAGTTSVGQLSSVMTLASAARVPRHRSAGGGSRLRAVTITGASHDAGKRSAGVAPEQRLSSAKPRR